MMTTKSIKIVHCPGYSAVDHVGEELRRMAEEEFSGRPQTIRSAQAAIRRAQRRARRLAAEQPLAYGVYRHGMPRLEARRQ